MRGALRSCVHEFYDSTIYISGGEKSMASAIPSGRTLENFSGKNQNAASFDRFTDAFVHCVYSCSLSTAFVTIVNDFSFCGAVIGKTILVYCLNHGWK